MKKILFLDDDKSLCSLLGMLLNELGAVHAVFINSYNELLKLQSEIPNYDIIFLDVNLGSNVPNGLDAFDWLKDNNFEKKVVFFTGHANTYPIIQKALAYPNVSVLEKPVAVDKIQDIIFS